ncbi:MAG: hypothetical protein QOI55_761 [Actinomycetota bacterium]|jgi:uncharacterized protein YndB with AHSA1/START domain|nr:hypothetical protein [Actinomycetota bacterium]
MPDATATDGRMDEFSGRWVLTFERRFRHPIERVWDALTQPARLAEWFGQVEVELDLTEGGRFEMRTTGPPELVEAVIAEAGEDALVNHQTVLRVEAPRVFEHTFGAPDSIVRWELEPDGDGTRLRLRHTEPVEFAPFEAGPRDLAGWHTLLDLLEHALDGAPVPWSKERWEATRDRYAARSG